MIKKFKQLVALGLVGSMALTGCGGSDEGADTPPTGSEVAQQEDSKEDNIEDEKEVVEESEEQGEPVVIRIGSHAAASMDPNTKDPVTGEYMMEEDARILCLEAAQIVKDQLNVEIEWVQYPGDVTEVLLQSVMAGDPIADVVNLYANSQGTVLGQNVLQPIDDYLDVFEGTPPAPIYGGHYFLQVSGGGTHPLSPLFYNIDYIEAVDALKVDGETVYPTDLYLEGEWTWSVFEDYLAKIDAHYANSQGPERPENRIDAYRTDYTETLIQAMHSAGGSIYGDEGSGIDSPGTIEAVNFVQDLIEQELLVCPVFEGTSNRGYNAQGLPFELGESVFTNIEDWRSSYAAAKATERGESLGFIPFPRPDHMEFDDPDYRQVRTGGETWAILRGVDEEKVPLAIQTYQLYMSELGRLRTEAAGGPTDLPPIRLSIDLFHEEIGADMQDIYYASTSQTIVNEFSNMTGTYWNFMGLAGDAIYGIDGSSNYEVALEANRSEIDDKLAQMESILSGTEVRDNILPRFTLVEEGKTFAFAKGTDPATIEWTKEFTVSDNIDGELNPEDAVYEVAEGADFNTVGVYRNGVIGSISDSSENERRQGITFTIYDGENTVAPTLTIKEEYRTIALEEDTSKINWAGDFVETATDADGLNIGSKIVADLSELDTTTAGEYDVELTLTDYAGNVSTQTITVTVEVK